MKIIMHGYRACSFHMDSEDKDIVDYRILSDEATDRCELKYKDQVFAINKDFHGNVFEGIGEIFKQIKLGSLICNKESPAARTFVNYIEIITRIVGLWITLQEYDDEDGDFKALRSPACFSDGSFVYHVADGKLSYELSSERYHNRSLLLIKAKIFDKSTDLYMKEITHYVYKENRDLECVNPISGLEALELIKQM